ncbi:MAG: endonuclease/exonuclease/phosphatase family protein [Tannerellaceae bacterium]|nr:endonuclease/exonuclease/phosphatase family protein [Tannerellaceae bacterium]
MKKIMHIIVGALISSMLFSTTMFAQELKVMSYNVKAFEGQTNDPDLMFRLQPFADAIKRYNPDIICIQELETHTSRQGARELLTELGSLLGMYPLFGFSYVKDVGWYGNGILSKYPIMNTFSNLLPYNSSRSYDQRSYVAADILVPATGNAGGKIVRIVNTHLDHRYNSPWYGQREEHANRIVEDALDSAIPTILMGDMNEDPTGTNSKAIVAFSAACDRICDNSGTFSSSKLDYIFGFPKNIWTVIDYTVDRTNNLSDHYPIIGTVKLGN